MPKNNRKCAYCGTSYYACGRCIGTHSIKNLCCSSECWLKYWQEQEKLQQQQQNFDPIVIDEGETNMMGILKDKTEIEITGYDLSLGRFDCQDKVTRLGEDFDSFVLNWEELKDIANI